MATKTAKIDDKAFASVAEAVAHYWGLGFQTFEHGEAFRVMRKGEDHHSFEEVLLVHKGLLDVSASHVHFTDGSK